MAGNEFDITFFEQFLDDFFAEADEHLLSIRRHLLEIEEEISRDQTISKLTINELFRSFHTLKGISAMANVPLAETLAHYLESYLRPVRDGERSLSRAGLDVLIDGTKKIEETVSARRTGEAPPDIDAYTARLHSMISEGETDVTVASKPAETISPVTKDSSRVALYKFEFEPSNELADRGININSVRSRIEAIGKIRESKPLILSGGKIAFEIIVATGAPESEFVGWNEDGLSFQRLIESSADDGPSSLESAKSGLFGSANTVRVDLARLDELMRMIGELVISRARLEEQLGQIARLLPTDRERNLIEINNTLEKQLRDLRDGVMRVRMVPIGEIFERMQFVARDLARGTDKKLRLTITGENTEIDKLLVERMLDPLLHLVRNAVSHGIETAEDRAAAGKPVEGALTLSAATEGDSVLIQISDDGRGIDREEVAAKATERGFLIPQGEFDDKRMLDVLCSPGFSTRTEADKTSGRGVGMDVVKRTIDDLNGSLAIETDRSEGTRFTIRLPLTLAIADALIVAVGGERFAVPQSGVREILEVPRSSVTRFEKNEVMQYRGEALPLIRLSTVFNLEDRFEDVFHAFVVDHARKPLGIAVDKVIGQREIVVRTTNDPLLQVAGVGGATELGDGKAILILNVPELVNRPN